MELKDRESLVVHIEGLQATLTKRNERIAELEAQISNGTLTDREKKKEYKRGWEACASEMINMTNQAAQALGKIRKDAYKIYSSATGEF